MDIHINEFELRKELAEHYLDAERASLFIDDMIDISNFCRDAEPTRSNLALAETMINQLNIRLGGKAITFEGGIYNQSMHGLDEERIQETGSRIWRAIVDIVRRVIAVLRSLWKRFFADDEKKSREAMSAMESLEEKFGRAELTWQEMNFGRKELLGQEIREQLDEAGGIVFVDSPGRRKMIHPTDARNNLLLSVNLAELAKEVPLFRLTGKDPISTIVGVIEEATEYLEHIKKLGSNQDLFAFGRSLVHIQNEAQFLGLLKQLDTLSSWWQEQAKNTVEEVKRKSRSKVGIPIGGNALNISFSKVSVGKQAIPYATASLQASVGMMGKSARINGSLSVEDIKRLLDVQAVLIDVRKALETISEEYNSELEYYTGDGRAEILKDATQRIGELEVTPAVRDKIQAVQKLPKDLHNILLREQKVFSLSADAAQKLSLSISQAIDWLLRNTIMYDGALSKNGGVAVND